MCDPPQHYTVVSYTPNTTIKNHTIVIKSNYITQTWYFNKYMLESNAHAIELHRHDKYIT